MVEKKFPGWTVVVEEGYQLDREGKSEKGGWEEHEKYHRQHSHKDLQSIILT